MEKNREKIDEIFRKNGIGLKEICEWFIQTYPEDIFTGNSGEGLEVIAIRDSCKKILERLRVFENVKNKKGV